MSIIVLEGSDASGKTSFVNELARKTGFEIYKGSSFEISKLGSSKMFEYMMRLLDKERIIIDRFYFSNIIYGQLFDYPMMEIWQYEALRDMLNKNGIVIYLHAEEDIIINRIKSRGDEYISSRDISEILDLYKETMSGAFSPKTMISLDTSNSNLDLSTSMVAQMIRSDETRAYLMK